MANVHPWFGNVSINDAANWTYEFFEETDVAVSNALSNKPTMYIAETGWPTVSCLFLFLEGRSLIYIFVFLASDEWNE